jgi:hypothetical protein
MIDLIRKLPTEIINNIIIPYTYNLQNKNLLEDIVNYKNTRVKIDEIYYNFWIIYLENENPEDKYWMINDLFIYANDYNPTINGYVEKFYRIFYRNTRLQSITTVNKYVEQLEKKQVNSQINILWGLLIPTERNAIIIDSQRRCNLPMH